MRHPFQFCATRYCCCCDLDSDVTCYLVAVICIVINGFSGITNIGVNQWFVYVFSIGNILIYILAGTVLFLGTFWNKDGLKVAYCWLVFIAIFTVITAMIIYWHFYRDIYIIWGNKCHEFNKTAGIVILLCNFIWLLAWNIYTPMVILGNLSCKDECCVTEVFVGLRCTSEAKMDDSEESEIRRLHRKGSWEEILEKFSRNKFLPWIWPSRENLEFIGRSVRNQNSENIISVGCGSGLLEWLLKMATGLEVTGIEIDKTWWKSKYSLGTFIPLTIVDDSTRGELHLETQNSVLLFCYFNNGKAFSRYLFNFEGDCFIVIGPGPGRGTYTVPEPFRLPEGLDEEWELFDQQEIRSSKDFIAVYVRRRKKKQWVT